jgi:tRNA-dihydrouridine synthase B
MKLGSFTLSNNVFVAPMAGVTDRPFRQLCKSLGAGYAVSEMAASNPKLWASIKTSRRTNHDGEMEPRSVQIAGADAQMMAECAQFNVAHGAQVIDINMGCPAKKVCNVLAGSALMGDLSLAEKIIDAVVRSVNVPVTLKMRTGPDRSNKNALELALRAESLGVQMITIHGRTRADAYQGAAEYDTVTTVKAKVSVPVVVNGDIDSPQKARQVLALTGADAVMIGRAAQGRPWLPGQIAVYLKTGLVPADPSFSEIRSLMRDHLAAHYAFYGEFTGVRTARKHIGWYSESWHGGQELRDAFNSLDCPVQQMRALDDFFEQHIATERFNKELAA